MGIVLVLIVVSLVGAAALYLMDVTKVTQDKIVLDARVLSYNQLVKNVTAKLHSGNICTQLLGGRDVTGAFNRDGLSISLDLKLEMNEEVLSAPVGNKVWFVAGGTSIKDVKLYITEKVRAPVRLAASGSPRWVAALGHILIYPGHPGTGMRLPRNSHYKIPIFIYYERVGSQKILRSCFDPASEAYYCTLAGGVFTSNPSIPVDQRCQPDRICFSKRIVSSPGGCSYPYEAVTVSAGYYRCDWCNKNILLAPEPLGRFYVPYGEPTSPAPIPP